MTPRTVRPLHPILINRELRLLPAHVETVTESGALWAAFVLGAALATLVTWGVMS